MIKLINTYHDTSAITRKTREEIDAIIEKHPGNRTIAEKKWVNATWGLLCGMAGCCCGNELGERG